MAKSTCGASPHGAVEAGDGAGASVDLCVCVCLLVHGARSLSVHGCGVYQCTGGVYQCTVAAVVLPISALYQCIRGNASNPQATLFRGPAVVWDTRSGPLFRGPGGRREGGHRVSV